MGDNSRNWLQKLTGFREFMVLLAVILLSIFIYGFNQNFLTPYNIQVIVRQVAIFGIMAIAETTVIITGGIDLSAGSMLAFYGVMVAMFMMWGFSPPIAIIMLLLLCIVVGLYHGAMITRVGLVPFIVTLGSLSIFRGLAVVITQGYPIRIESEFFLWIGQGLILGIPVPLLILLAVALTMNYILNYTPLGRHIYAIGGNREAALLSGIPVKRVLTFVYIQATVLFGISAIIMAARLGQGMPGVGIGYELNAIAAAIIGGTSLYGGIGTVLGSIIGATLMALIDNLLVLLRVPPWWSELIVGMVIVLAVTVDMITARRRASS
jgi:ribose transport system permease protein